MNSGRLIVPITASGDSSPHARVTVRAVAGELSRITPRDRDLLNLLAAHRTFSTEQIAAMCFGSSGRALNRLNQLRTRGVLDRFRHYQRPGSQSWRWTLAPLGAAIVAAGRGEALPRSATVREATARLSASPTLDHLLAVNGFFAALTHHARRDRTSSLDLWWSEAKVRQETANMVRPDGHGVWVEGGRRAPFWLEVDLGTETLARLVAKLDDYARLVGTSLDYPVLFWLDSTTREANLHNALARAGVPAGVRVATATTTEAQPGGGPAAAVWWLVGDPQRVRLAELPGPSHGQTP